MTVDVADPDLYAAGDPIEVWERLRAEAPLHWNDHPAGGGFWAVMRYGPALEIYKDNAAFTSEQGMRLGADPQAVAAAAGRMLIVTDPPRHSKIRRLMNPVLSPRRTAALAEMMRSILEPLVDAALEAQVVDFVSDVAAVLPSAIVCHLMDVRQEERLSLVELTSTAFGSALGPGACPVSDLSRVQANAKIFRYYLELLQQRRAIPAEDIVSVLAGGTVDGAALTDTDIIMNCNGLLSGANETTRLASAGALLALIENPRQWASVRNGDVGLESSVEEILRYSSPAMHVTRVARTKTEIDGFTIRPGERVAIWTPSVNRDEAMFDRPHCFDLGRSPNRHLAFGAGTHFCIGASLARIELTVFLAVLLEKIDHAEIVGPVRRMRSNFMWGLESLPVRLSAR